MIYRTISLALLALGVAVTAAAAPRDYEFDMGHSRIFFDVNHRGYSTMHGRFADFGGTFRFDAENPAASSLDVTVDAATIDMFHDGLNDHLKTADFFNVEVHPELRFVSERIEAAGENRFTVHGQFTMLGQTHPLSLDVVLNQTGEAQGGVPMAGFTAMGTVDRTLYGMNYGAPLVGTNISIRIEVEARETESS